MKKLVPCCKCGVDISEGKVFKPVVGNKTSGVIKGRVLVARHRFVVMCYINKVLGKK